MHVMMDSGCLGYDRWDLLMVDTCSVCTSDFMLTFALASVSSFTTSSLPS